MTGRLVTRCESEVTRFFPRPLVVLRVEEEVGLGAVEALVRFDLVAEEVGFALFRRRYEGRGSLLLAIIFTC